jgi:hypothetical protein
MKYSVDLGRWDEGVCVPFEAENHHAAIAKAYAISREKNMDLVEVRLGEKHPGVPIFDSLNGRY